MSLKLMYITNDPKTALTAENAGVDRIFVDMEYIGKAQRQKGLDTVQNHHTIDDVKRVREVLKNSELLVRINPIHDGSAKEIDDSIAAGADIIMLPYFKSAREVKEMIDMVAFRAKVLPLLETPEAVDALDDILALSGIDEIHIGINDLSLGYGKRFMFEVLADGTVERICTKLRGKLPYGFGGIASLDSGLIPAQHIIMEHYRLGSSLAILSRSFCNISKAENSDKVEQLFDINIKKIREFEEYCAKADPLELEENRKETCRLIMAVANR